MGAFEISPMNIFDIAMKIIPDNSKSMEQHQKAGILFNMLYAECVNNIQILDSIKKDISFTRENTYRAVKTIAPLLKTEAGQLILLGQDGSLKELKVMQEAIDYVELEVEDNSESVTDVTPQSAKTLRQAISFCVNKIKFLQNYAQIEEENLDLFTDLTLKTRINNINNYSKQIKKQLQTQLSSLFE